MVLTEERQVDPYPMASLEEGTLATEQLYYHIPVDGSTRVHKQSISGYPEDGSTNPNDYVHKLNGSGSKLGTSLVLKVMSGDTINLRANSWYRLNGETPDEPVSPLNDLLTALASGISQKTFGKFTNTQLLGSGLLSPGISGLLNRQSYSAIKPKAYVNWILFDEQFKYVNEGSGFDQVGSDEEFKTHFLAGLQVPKNGYLYIYVSNETPNVDVFFDNLQVTHVRGPLLEETHYYPFGLTMAGISSKAAGKMENKHKYNGIELNEDLGLNTYDAFFRNLDPQIGKWWQIDPKVEGYEAISPYASNYNNPIRYSDPLGDEGDDDGVFSRAWNWAKSVVSDAKDFVGGASAAIVDNQTLGVVNNRKAVSKVAVNKQASDAGQDFGDMISAAWGVIETGVGLFGQGGGLLAAPVTGVVSLAVTVASTGLVVHGAATTVTAAKNLITQKDRANSTGESKPYSKKEAREKAKEKRAEQPASEDYVKYKAKELEKSKGKDARRKAHDAKKPGQPDRSKSEVDKDYKIKH